MEMTPVQNSSMLSEIGYDEDTFTLAVRYKSSGDIYHLANVSPEVHDDLIHAESIGGHFNKHLKGKFPTTKQGPDGPEPPKQAKPKAEPQVVDASAEYNQESPAQGDAPAGFKDEAEAISTALVVAATAKSLVISTPKQYEQAGRDLLWISAEKNKRIAWFKPLKQLAKAAHDAICGREKEALGPLNEAAAHLELGMRNYREADRIARENEQKRVDEENRKRAEEDARLRTAELAKRDAEVLTAQGRHEEAAAVVAAPRAVVPAYQQPTLLISEVPKVEGLSFVGDWDFEVVGDVPLSHDFYSLDEKKIRAYAKRLGKHARAEGIRFFPIERKRAQTGARKQA